jgi:hypothetical protein
MPDFYADHPFREVVLKFADAEKFCSVGDIIIGMNNGAQGRVERFVADGILVHPIKPLVFEKGDVLVTPTASTEIHEVVSW